MDGISRGTPQGGGGDLGAIKQADSKAAPATGTEAASIYGCLARQAGASERHTLLQVSTNVQAGSDCTRYPATKRCNWCRTSLMVASARYRLHAGLHG
jgi:hypothetical protein